MRTHAVLGLGAAALLTLAAAAPAHAAYSVTTYQFPGDTFTQFLGINDGGTVAGFHGAVTAQGFTFVPPAYTTENYPAAAQTMVVGINNAGSTAGIYIDAGGTTHGFTRIGGVFATVDAPGTAFNQLLGINSSNVAVGYSSTDPAGMVLQKAYSVAGSSFTDINALLPVNANSQATGINTAGKIVGFYQPTATTSIGFLDSGGTISTIDPLGSTFTQALGINDKGEIVGFYVDGMGNQHGYTDLGGVFSSFDIAGAASVTVNGVNNLGQLVGFATIGDAVDGFIATPVPEPASLALLGAGALGLAGLRRRRAG